MQKPINVKMWKKKEKTYEQFFSTFIAAIDDMKTKKKHKYLLLV